MADPTVAARFTGDLCLPPPASPPNHCSATPIVTKRFQPYTGQRYPSSGSEGRDDLQRHVIGAIADSSREGFCQRIVGGWRTDP